MATHFLNLNNTKRIELLVIILCLLIGFTLRFYTFDQKSLWVDEVHTFNDARDDLKGQMRFYKETPTYLHPPLFFIVTHLFYPFTKPERDLHIIPLIFGTISIPTIYFLSRSFSQSIALPCTLSLTFMAYHIYFSQEGRPYSMLMFLGMIALCFFMQHLITLRKGYLFLASLFFALSFYTSYSAIPFMIFSQILWFYDLGKVKQKPFVFSLFLLNGLLFLLCIPWLLFVALNYRGQPIMDPHHTEDPGSFGSILYWVLNDWVANLPLMVVSAILLVLFTFVSRNKKNSLMLLAVLIFPIGSLYLFCRILNITHFFTSKYFITFLPLFFISIYLSLNAIEIKFERLKRFMRPKLLFTILLVTSNLLILPLYYRSEKQDFKGLVTYLKSQLRNGDNVFVRSKPYLPGILHYFGATSEGRHYPISLSNNAEKELKYWIYLVDQNKAVTIYHSMNCCAQYLGTGNRLWIIVEKTTAKEFIKNSPAVLKAYFDGSFANFRKFPTDASMYLFLWDPKSPDEKGIKIPID